MQLGTVESKIEPGTVEPACIMCGAPTQRRHRLPLIWHQPPGTRSFAIHWCPGCEFGLLWPRPEPEELARYYGSAYFSTYGDRNSARPAKPTWIERLVLKIAWLSDRSRPFDTRFVEELLAGRKGTICDLGCGNGGAIRELARAGHVVLGVEPDPVALANASSEGAEVWRGTAEELPKELRTRTFDVVLMNQVLEHCGNPLLALANARSLLAQGGRLLVDVPNCDSAFARRLGPAWYHCDAGRHLNFFTARSLKALLKLAGFENVETSYWGLISQFIPSRWRDEQAVWDRYAAQPSAAAVVDIRRPSRLGRAARLVPTLLAPAASRYEILGAIASDTPR